MKKILSMLAVACLGASTTGTVVSCYNVDGGNASLTADDKQVLYNYNTMIGEGPLLFNADDYQKIDVNDLKTLVNKKLELDKINTNSDKYEISPIRTLFTPIRFVDNNNFSDGVFSFHIYHNKEMLKNNNTGIFSINFTDLSTKSIINNFFDYDQFFSNKTATLSLSKDGWNLSDLKTQLAPYFKNLIDLIKTKIADIKMLPENVRALVSILLDNAEVLFNTTFSTIINLLNLGTDWLFNQEVFSLLPTTLPKLNQDGTINDENKEIAKFESAIESLVQKFKPDFSLAKDKFAFNINNGIKISIATDSYKTLLESVLPDLINFKYYISHNKELWNQNHLFTFIKYLLMPKGDTGLNNMNNINKFPNDFSPKTNLDNILFDLMGSDPKYGDNTGWVYTDSKIISQYKTSGLHIVVKDKINYMGFINFLNNIFVNLTSVSDLIIKSFVNPLFLTPNITTNGIFNIFTFDKFFNHMLNKELMKSSFYDPRYQAVLTSGKLVTEFYDISTKQWVQTTGTVTDFSNFINANMIDARLKLIDCNVKLVSTKNINSVYHIYHYNTFIIPLNA